MSPPPPLVPFFLITTVPKAPLQLLTQSPLSLARRLGYPSVALLRRYRMRELAEAFFEFFVAEETFGGGEVVGGGAVEEVGEAGEEALGGGGGVGGGEEGVGAVAEEAVVGGEEEVGC